MLRASTPIKNISAMTISSETKRQSNSWSLSRKCFGSKIKTRFVMNVNSQLTTNAVTTIGVTRTRPTKTLLRMLLKMRDMEVGVNTTMPAAICQPQRMSSDPTVRVL